MTRTTARGWDTRRGDAARQRIVRFLGAYWRDHGYAPNHREIADAVGLGSIASVVYHLRRLVDKGVVERAPGLARSARLTGMAARYLGEEEADAG